MSNSFEIIVRAKDGVPDEQIAAIAEGLANGLEEGWDVALRPSEDTGMTEAELTQVVGGALHNSDIVIRPRGARRSPLRR